MRTIKSVLCFQYHLLWESGSETGGTEPQTELPHTGEECFSGFGMNKGEWERRDVSSWFH